MSGTIRNWERWSEIDEVRLPETELGVWMFEKMLSIRVLEVVLILVGWTICDRNICEESESKNSFVDACHISKGQHWSHQEEKPIYFP